MSEFEQKIRIVAAGVDSLWITYGFPLRKSIRRELEDAKSTADRSRRVGRDPVTQEPLTPDASPVTIGGIPWTIRPYGAAEGPLLGFHEHVGQWALAPDAGADQPSLRVRLFSRALWSDGVRQCVAWADALALGMCRAGEPLTRRYVPEIHLACDFQGWLPTRVDLERFSARGSPTNMIHPELEELAFAPMHVRNALERSRRLRVKAFRDSLQFDEAREFERYGEIGFCFGKGATQVAGYNKTREIIVSQKPWFKLVWSKSSDYVEGEPVYRVEVRVAREVLKDLRDDGAVPLETVEEVIANGSAIFRTAMREKVRLTTGEATRLHRSPTHPVWQLLTDTVEFDGTSEGRVTRLEQDTITADALVPKVRGYVGKYGALEGENNLDAVMGRLTQRIRAECDERGEPFEKLVKKKSEARSIFEVRRTALDEIATNTRRARGRVAGRVVRELRKRRRWASALPQLELQFPWRRTARQLAFAWSE